MSAALHANYQGLSISEMVPGAIDMADVKASSILTGRRRIRLQPQTGPNAGPQTIIQFTLSDSTGLMDVNSAVISFTPVITSPAPVANGKVCCLDDGPSFCRRIQILANGSLIDDVDQAHKAANIELLSAAGADWYKHNGSYLNFWKFNETLTNPSSFDLSGGVLNKGVSAFAQNAVIAHGFSQTTDNSGFGFQQAYPLGLLAPSMRSSKYFPLRNMGELNIQIQTASAIEAIFCNTVGQTPSYTLFDISLEVDIVSVAPQFAALLDRMTQMESEPGLVIPVATKLVSAGQNISQAGGSLTESNVIVSRATNNLRRVDFAMQPTGGLATYAYPSVSCFPDAGFASIQYRVGSLYYPSLPANSLSRAYSMTQAAYGEVANTDRSSVYNRHNYDTTTTVAGAVFANLPNVSGQFNGNLTSATNIRFQYSDFAPKSYCFDSAKGGEVLDADGISVLGQAGSQIVNIIRCANPEDCTPLVVLTATKFLVLKDGGVRVQGA